MPDRIPWLGPDDPFPVADRAMSDPNGLLAAGGDLSVPRLLDAYGRGIFPWYSEGEPLLWWSPDPRMVLFTRELRVSQSLRRVVRSGRFTVSADTQFVKVMEGCAAPRADGAGTWISPEMIDAYARLHRLGHAHSVEIMMGPDLVGGLYGVALGRMFFGESMFSRKPDASKVALVHLVRQLEHWGFEMVDCQMSTEHLRSMGAREVGRGEFTRRIQALVREPGVPAPWVLDAASRERSG